MIENFIRLVQVQGRTSGGGANVDPEAKEMRSCTPDPMFIPRNQYTDIFVLFVLASALQINFQLFMLVEPEGKEVEGVLDAR